MGAPDPVGSVQSIQAAASEAQVTSVQASLQNSGEVNASTATFSSMEDMKLKYPEVYNAFMLAFANNMRAEQQRLNDRVVEEMKKQRSGS